MKNRPRIKPFTNTRMERGAFVHSLSIRGWSWTAKVNALWEPRKGVILQVKGGEELRPFFGRTLTPSVLDRTLKKEL